MKYTSRHIRRTMFSPMETKFQQEFYVDDGREFNEDELVLLQILYRRLTVDFSPAPATDIESKITTTCTIENQVVGSTRHQNQTGFKNPDARTLTVEYTMKFESRYYKMTHYPRMFQNWITGNLNVILTRMQEIGINVNRVNIPMSTQLDQFLRGGQMQLLGIKLNEENNPASSLSSSIPSPIALSALTMGITIDRRKRQPKRSDSFGEPKTIKKIICVREHNGILRPERRTPIAQKLREKDSQEIRI